MPGDIITSMLKFLILLVTIILYETWKKVKQKKSLSFLNFIKNKKKRFHSKINVDRMRVKYMKLCKNENKIKSKEIILEIVLYHYDNLII